jgi:putative NIF3 family GTP cyclohydrolase 1 type 2
MTLQQIQQLAIQLGIKHDLRGEAKVKKNLARVNEKYATLSKSAKEEFDSIKLTNPYSDSRILVDTGRKTIKKVLAGIDMEGPELLLAKQMGDIDLVIAHHPEGRALSDLHDVMSLQAEVLSQYGVPINVAESVIKPRISEVSRGVAPINHNRSVDMARALGLDFMCCHTIQDNMAAKFVINVIDKNIKKIDQVGDILKLLKTIPEYQAASKNGMAPRLFVGHEEASVGKIVVTEFTGGTNGSKDIYEKMSQAGIGTIIGMHMSEEHRKEAERHHINVVIAGHMSSDSLGMNLFLDELEQKGIEVVPISGLIRVKRKK